MPSSFFGKAAAQVQHPNIVNVHEVGRDGETLYIVSDFVSGLTLGDWMTGKKASYKEAAELIAKVAEAVEKAHEAGVIHRDLKPSNIMMDDDGEPRIMDFGLAKRDAAEITMTMDGKVLGTPAYMSPEQARGEANQATNQSDVYSLGVILFELVTGERPFRGNMRMLLHQVLNEEAPSPRTLNRKVSKDIETICHKCLEKEPEKRYPTAGELARELQRFVRDEPIRARRVTIVERNWRWAKRNPVVATLSLATSVLVTVLVAVFAIDRFRPPEERIINPVVEKTVAEKYVEEVQLLATAQERFKKVITDMTTAIESFDQQSVAVDYEEDSGGNRYVVGVMFADSRGVTEIWRLLAFTRLKKVHLPAKTGKGEVLEFLDVSQLDDLKVGKPTWVDVDLSGREVDVADMPEMTELVRLRLANCSLASIGQLEKFVALEEVDVLDNPALEDLSSLANLPIRKLNAEGTGVRDLRGFVAGQVVDTLEEVNLYRTPSLRVDLAIDRNDLLPLVNCARLRVLKCDEFPGEQFARIKELRIYTPFRRPE